MLDIGELFCGRLSHDYEIGHHVVSFALFFLAYQHREAILSSVFSR